MATVELTNNLVSLLDDEDVETVSRFAFWQANKNRNTHYARTACSGKYIYMHRLLMRPEQGMVVDHINGNGLDNRRANLRVCTPAENSSNRVNTTTSYANRTSRFLGVYRDGDGKRWVAEITHRSVRHYLGRFDSEEEAAVARKAAESILGLKSPEASRKAPGEGPGSEQQQP